MSTLTITLLTVFGALTLLAAVTLTAGRLIHTQMLRRYRLATRASLRLTPRVIVPLAGLGLCALLLIDLEHPLTFSREHAAALALSLAAGISGALAFTTDDALPLELLFSAPRPAPWLVLERLLILTAPLLVMGLTFSAALVVSGETSQNLAESVAGWLTPLLLLMGIGVSITLATGQTTLGVVSTALLWFLTAYMGDYITLLYPQLWPLHPFLKPMFSTNESVFWLNRLLLSMVGLSLILSAAQRLQTPWRLLGSTTANR